jgi:WD40 repeat protein
MKAQRWETTGWNPVGEALEHQGMATSVAFSPDGKYVLTGSWDNTARVWEAGSCRVVGPALRHAEKVKSVAFSPDGRYMLTGSADKTARLWPFSPAWEGTPERIALTVNILTGRDVDSGARLDLEPWLQRRRQLELLGGPLAP